MRRRPSREMPPAPQSPWTDRCVVTLTSLLAGLAALCWWQPLFLAPIGAFALATVILNVRHMRHLRRLAEVRRGQSICSFARSFNCRAIDTWVIRAVYEGLQAYHRGTHPNFPWLATDQFEEDLRMDAEDLEDLVHEMAGRAGRAMGGAEENPLFGRVQTVGDLVHFLSLQPSIL